MLESSRASAAQPNNEDSESTKFDVRMKPQIQITSPNATLRLDSGEWRQEKCGTGAATGSSPERSTHAVEAVC